MTAEMNKIWQERLQKSRERIEQKKYKAGKIMKFYYVIILALIMCFIFPEYPKRMIYPALYGKPYDKPLEISTEDYFEDVNTEEFNFERNGMQYKLLPRTKYAITAKVGYVDHYDTFFNIIFRGQYQADYINLVPQDLILLNGGMAKPEVFKLFEFEHEERLGRVLCKGVKYKRSFASFHLSAKSAQKSNENYAKCSQFIKQEEYNNYHPIPATERINRALSMLVKGDVIHIEGYLVDVPQMGLNTGTRKNQTHKNMITNGMKPGMCFILYTTKLIFNNRIYE